MTDEQAQAINVAEPSGPYWDFYIAGVKFHEAKKCMKDLHVGDFIQLTCEPTNQYDKNAVRIECAVNQDCFMLGYVPKKFSAEVTRAMMDLNLCCQVLEVNPENDTWTQLKVRVMENTPDPDYNVIGENPGESLETQEG